MNTKTTKIKKSFVALAALIAVLGVICTLLFTSNSFAEEQNDTATVTFSGAAVDGNNNGISNANVKLLINSGWEGESKYVECTTDASGNFSKADTIENPEHPWQVINVYINKEQTSSSFRAGCYKDIFQPISGATFNFGNLTCDYYGNIDFFINGIESDDNTYGSWAINYPSNGGPDDIFIFSTTAEYTISGNKVSILMHRGQGGTETLTWEWIFTPKSPYQCTNVTVSPVPFSESNGTNITTNLKFDASVDVQKHTISIGDNISSVKTADGTEITSGQEVVHGTTLYVTPETQAGHVSKIKVNGVINSTGVVVANSDLTINATVPEAVKISGVVTADDAVTNGNKDFSEILVEKAYAAEVGVEGATVSFTSTDGWNTQTLTDAEGAYALDVQKGMGGVLTISKEGFNTFTKEFTDAELNEDVQVTSELVKASSPQTGDITLYAFAVIALVLSGAVVLKMSRRPKGLHIK